MRDAAPVDRRRLKRGRSDWCGGGLGALGFRGNDRIQSRRKRQDKGFVGPYFKGQRLRRPAGCGPLPCLNVRGTLFTVQKALRLVNVCHRLLLLLEQILED